MTERIEERVRNMVNPFYNILLIFKNIREEKDFENIDKSLKYLIDHSEELSNAMESSIDYLIDMAKIIDEYLPNEFDKLLDKTKYKYESSRII